MRKKSNNLAKSDSVKGIFGKGVDIAAYSAIYNIPEADVAVYKQSFDLFDSDQGGSIDTKGISSITKN